MISLLIFSIEKFNLKISSITFVFIFFAASLITILSGERTSLALLILSIILMFFTCNKIRKFFFSILIIITVSLISIMFASEKIKKECLIKQLIN